MKFHFFHILLFIFSFQVNSRYCDFSFVHQSYVVASTSEYSKELFLSAAPEILIGNMSGEEVVSHISRTRVSHLTRGKYCDSPDLKYVEGFLREVSKSGYNVSIFDVVDHIFQMDKYEGYYRANTFYGKFLWKGSLDVIANYYKESFFLESSFSEHVEDLKVFRNKLLTALKVNVISWEKYDYSKYGDLSNSKKQDLESLKRSLRKEDIRRNGLLGGRSGLSIASHDSIILYNPDLPQFSKLFTIFLKSNIEERAFFEKFEEVARKSGFVKVSEISEFLENELL